MGLPRRREALVSRPGFAGGRLFESRRFGGLLDLRIITRFGLGRGNISDRLQQSPVVEPVDPFQRGELNLFNLTPRPQSPDHLGFVKTVDRLRESIVVGVSEAADRWLHAGVFQTRCVFHCNILNASVAMMNEAASGDRLSVTQRLFEGVEDGWRLR